MSVTGDRLPLEEFKAKDVPMLLLPYQQRWLADEANFRMYTKSRRIGISWADAGGAALKTSQTNGRNTFYIGYEKEMTRGYIQDAADWAKLYNLAVSKIEQTEEVFRDGDEDKSIQVFTLHFNSGFRVEALSSKPRNMRSRQGDLVLDEPAFQDDLKGMLKAAKAMRIWGGKIRLITTYNGVDNEYYELEQDVLAGKLPYSRHFTTFLDAIAEGLFQRICLVTGQIWTPALEEEFIRNTLEEFGSDADEELMCIPSQSGGAYLSRAAIEQCMSAEIPILKIVCKPGFVSWPEAERIAFVQDWIEEHLAPLMPRLNPNLKSFLGGDFGRTGDLSIFLPVQEQPNLVKAAPFALELRNVPYEQQRQILFWLCDRLPRFMAMALDARGNGNYLAEVAMQRYGTMRVHCIQASQPWYSENFPKYKAGLEDREALLPKASDWVDDHRAVTMIKGVPKVGEGKNKGSDGFDRHGDSAIAGVMMWFASLNGGVPIEFEAVGEERAINQFDNYFGEAGTNGF